MTETTEKDTTIPVPRDEDDIRQYLREIRQIPRLTPEEERELARRCAQGDEEAIRKMVNANLRLVVSVAKEYSGRGVGMDVVKKNVEEVGGTVSIASEPGVGMTTTLKIPLTMAIMDGMEVSVGNSVFTIPIHNIRQSFKIQPSDLIQDASGGELFKRMGQFYPVVRMRDLYQIPEGRENVEDGILIWLESGEHSYCLFVDELLGEQQVGKAAAQLSQQFQHQEPWHRWMHHFG